MKKLLIIEDDPIVSHVYRSRLEKEGYEVDVALDGQAGYYRLFEFKPDGLLLDLMLPKINGIELLRKIRAVRDFEKLPVVVFTNAYVANMIGEAFSAGASAVYNKSTVTPRQILDVFTTLFSGESPAVIGAPSTGTSSTPAQGNYLSNADDGVFQNELLSIFERSRPAALGEMRKLLHDLSKAPEDQRAGLLEQLFRKLRSFAVSAGMAGLPYLGKLGAAVEALTKEMIEKPKTITASTLRTLANALDLFGDLSRPDLPHDLADKPPLEILVVDDEVLSRRALVYSLEKAFIKATPVEDAEAALALSQTRKFDLLFLDVNMPGTDGFQLCDKLRHAGPNKNTPIIFVTSTADFQVRAQSTLRGASDIIAKPFLFIELTVKALTFSLRHRIDALKKGAPATTRTAMAPAPAEKPAEVLL